MTENPPEARISLREVTQETVRAICRLSDTLSDVHRRMVAPNAVSIAQAHFSENAWFRAIYADEEPVGFAMLYIGPDDPPAENQTIYYLWRFMIGGAHHGKGYGRRALEAIIDYVRSRGGTELRLSCEEGEGSPEGFYRRLGFERDGLMYDDEVGMRLVFELTPDLRKTRQLLHFHEPDRFEFEADIIEKNPKGQGRFEVILEHTYFYPTGGGQEHDEGTLGGARVVDVYKDETRGLTVHLVDGDATGARVRGIIDADRRRRHMQHHTAQHLLSGCFANILGLETVSANINGDSPSTLDLDGREPDRDSLREVEAAANRLIWEDREVRTYFAAPERLKEIPLRKAPKVTEDVRIVEIDGLDWSACGGTHVQRTGQIGVVKIVRIEKVKEKTRVHFVAGQRAFEHYSHAAEVGAELAAELSVGLMDLPAAVGRMAEQIKTQQRELGRLQAQATFAIADRLLREAEDFGGLRLAATDLDDCEMKDLRAIGRELLKAPRVVAVLGSSGGGRVSLLAACSADSGCDASRILKAALSKIDGRGGGDSQLAQGSGAGGAEQLSVVLDEARRLIRSERA